MNNSDNRITMLANQILRNGLLPQDKHTMVTLFKMSTLSAVIGFAAFAGGYAVGDTNSGQLASDVAYIKSIATITRDEQVRRKPLIAKAHAH